MSPNFSTYCLQLVIKVGSLTGPLGAMPTNAATAVPTPSIGLDPLGISSTYTPGDRYVGIASSRSGTCGCDQFPRSSTRRQWASEPSFGHARCPNGKTVRVSAVRSAPRGADLTARPGEDYARRSG